MKEKQIFKTKKHIIMETVLLNIDSPIQTGIVLLISTLIYGGYKFIQYKFHKNKEYKSFKKEVAECKKHTEGPDPWLPDADTYRNWHPDDIRKASILRNRWLKRPDTIL